MRRKHRIRVAGLVATAAAVVGGALGTNVAAQEKPDPPNGRYIGSILICNDGYRAEGGRCVKLPAVTNGRYIGSILICNDGYRAEGGRCLKLPAVANGTYIASILLCDPGYRRVSATSCARSSSTTPSVGAYVGLCRTDSHAVSGACLRVTSTAYRTRTVSVPTKLRPPSCAENGSCYGDISTETFRPKTVYVRSYVRRDGTYVRSHFRSPPRRWP